MFTNRKKRWSSGSGGGKRAIGNRMGRQFDKGHGAIPTRQASRPTIRREHGDATDRRIKHAILPNEPTVLRLDLRCNGLCTRSLRRRIVENIGGFVLENEPTGRG